MVSTLSPISIKTRPVTDGRPGLHVVIASRRESGRTAGAVVRVRVDGARPPFRLYLYVDGQLAEAWIPAAELNELVCPDLDGSRHTVTARAIDSQGRWGAASLLI